MPRALIVLLVITAAACSESPTGTPGIPTALAVIAQPVVTPDGVFITQPIVAVVDANGTTVAQAGIVVTASIAAGSGTLLGVTTATTASNGTAAFATLGIDGLGSQVLQFMASGVTAASSSPFSLATVALPSMRFVAHLNTTCGANTSSIMMCWGENTLNQMGNNNGNVNRTTPTAGISGNPMASIGLGSDHGCGLNGSGNGTGTCWGNNTYGQLGDSTNTTPSFATGVRGGHVFVSLIAGTSHSCGLTADGTAWCWGLNASGQLGDSTASDRNVPVAVRTPLKFTMLTAEHHTCGLTAAGAAWCWGTNTSGQVGDGTLVPRVAPTLVSGNIVFASISARGTSACGLAPNGVAYCWGGNNVGQLGDGTTTNRLVPTPVAGGHAFASIATSGSHTCALTARGVAWCWGDNAHGQLGDGTLGSHLVPTVVSSGVTFTVLVTGINHTCGRTTIATAACWGQNNEGQVGDGTFIDRSVPTAVTGGVIFGGN